MYEATKIVLDVAREKSETVDKALTAVETKKDAVVKKAKEVGGYIKEDAKNALDWLTETPEEKAKRKAEEEAKKKKEEQEKKDAEEAEKKRMKLLKVSYILHGACILCSNGIREGYLIVPNSHGEFIHNSPQLNVADSKGMINIRGFGGCNSAENPEVQKVAKDIIKKADEEVDEGVWGKVMGLFAKDEDEDADLVGGEDSLISQCAGKCTPIFDTEWIDGEKDVLVDGKAALLGRCKLKCIYGGEITFYTSGQPEDE